MVSLVSIALIRAACVELSVLSAESLWALTLIVSEGYMIDEVSIAVGGNYLVIFFVFFGHLK